jgi:hypothetical protein
MNQIGDLSGWCSQGHRRGSEGIVLGHGAVYRCLWHADAFRLSSLHTDEFTR